VSLPQPSSAPDGPVPPSSAFLSGIVEGFYGTPWPWSVRLQYPTFLAAAGLNTYLYCPKSDPYLRKAWREPWPDSDQHHLRELARACAEQGIVWGVGLSPYALYQRYGPAERAALRQRILSLNGLGAPLLAILFDDMPGDLAALAQRQSDIVADVLAWTDAARVLMCPTYYSFDPVLQRFFGKQPDCYWEDLGRLLPSAVDILWTGNRVCSATIDAADVAAIAVRLGRPVTLWDNYPVNDGRSAWQHLYLLPLTGRSPALAHGLRGHLCNPMSQGLLSMMPLLGLAMLYGGVMTDLRAWTVRWLGADVAPLLLRDVDCFASEGLAQMAPALRERLRREYAACVSPAAAEVVAWLDEDYRFDPACLTG